MKSIEVLAYLIIAFLLLTAIRIQTMETGKLFLAFYLKIPLRAILKHCHFDKKKTKLPSSFLDSLFIVDDDMKMIRTAKPKPDSANKFLLATWVSFAYC